MNKIKILIADDNKNFVNLLFEVMSKEEDIEVVDVAYDGKECVEKVVKHNPDILLVDLIMPVIDGIGILRYLKENQIEVNKVIMMTGFGQEEVTKQALNFGASYFILKPFDVKYAIQYIRDIMSKKDKAEEKDIKKEIQELILKAGIPANLKGYLYIKECVFMAYQDESLTGAITKIIYPEIARKFNTTSSRVERAIRHAIEIAWNKGENEFLKELFEGVLDVTKTRPTNGELIFLLAEKLRIKRKDLE